MLDFGAVNFSIGAFILLMLSLVFYLLLLLGLAGGVWLIWRKIMNGSSRQRELEKRVEQLEREIRELRERLR